MIDGTSILIPMNIDDHCIAGAVAALVCYTEDQQKMWKTTHFMTCKGAFTYAIKMLHPKDRKNKYIKQWIVESYRELFRLDETLLACKEGKRIMPPIDWWLMYIKIHLCEAWQTVLNNNKLDIDSLRDHRVK